MQNSLLREFDDTNTGSRQEIWAFASIVVTFKRLRGCGIFLTELAFIPAMVDLSSIYNCLALAWFMWW